MIVPVNISYNKTTRQTIYEFMCDSDADFALLPQCDPGSLAVSAETANAYIVNASGIWVPFGGSV